MKTKHDIETVMLAWKTSKTPFLCCFLEDYGLEQKFYTFLLKKYPESAHLIRVGTTLRAIVGDSARLLRPTLLREFLTQLNEESNT